MALRWTHEFNTKMNLRMVFRQLFWHVKDFGSTPEVTAETEKLDRWSYDGIRCIHDLPYAFAIRSELEHFRYRVSI